MSGITLTAEEIKHLAQFAGFRVDGEVAADDKENEIRIKDAPMCGVKDDDGSIIHCKHIAYLDEYPEEGVYPLGFISKEPLPRPVLKTTDKG